MAAFVWRYAVSGGKPLSDAASVIGFNGHATDALPTSTYLDLEMHILTLRIASRHIPEAGAVCGSSARTDLCGGRSAMSVPTAIPCAHCVRFVRAVRTGCGESEGGSAPLRYAPPVPLRSSPPTRRPRPTPHALPGGSGDRGAQGRQGWRRSSWLAPSWWHASGAGQGLVKERRREKGKARAVERVVSSPTG